MLFAAIAQQCGRELPSATIYHAPTIAALAALLEQPALPRFSPIVQIKPGTQFPPVLVAHGLTGRAQFFNLARHIQTERPIYGIQAKGLDGMEEPLDRIEDMATHCLDSIRQLQPHGPYLWIGYSFGGLVALEIAQRLLQDGETIGLLVLVDAYPHPRFLSPGQRMRLMVRRAIRQVSEVNGRSVGEGISYLIRGLRNRLRAPEASGGYSPGVAHLSLAHTTKRIKGKAYVALSRYRPQFYGGKIRFVKSEGDRYFPGDPVGVWANLAIEFQVDLVRGAHLDMVTTRHEELASILTRYLQETCAPESNR